MISDAERLLVGGRSSYLCGGMICTILTSTSLDVLNVLDFLQNWIVNWTSIGNLVWKIERERYQE